MGYHIDMLNNILNQAVKTAPHHPAILYRDEVIDYQAFLSHVEKLAAGLMQSGGELGDRVAFFLDDCIEEIWCYYACFKIGAIAVPLYSGLRGQDLSHILHETTPKFIITDANHYPHIKESLSTLNNMPQCYVIGGQNDLPQYSGVVTFPEIKPNTIASIFYTSGTTAKPKGVVHTHEQIMANIQNVSILFGINSHDRFLTPGALDFNANICSIVLPCAYNNATLILLRCFDENKVFEAIAEKKVTIVFMVPSRYTQLIAYAKKHHPFSHTLRFSVTGGDAPPEGLFEDFKKCFQAPLCLGMGMTETLYQTHNLSTSAEKQGSVGLPLNDIKLKIVDESNNALPAEKTGELLIKSPAGFLEYWGHPEATAETLKEGWVYSGDLGYLDSDGYLWLQGRKKDIIIREGDNISPMEVERVIRSYAGIADAAVFGMADKKYGSSIHAFIVTNKNADVNLDQLKTYLESQLADYKVPQTIHIIDSLPVNKRGKLNRFEIIKLYESNK